MATDADSQSRPADLVPEEGVEASSAIGMGYTESKWIAEEILLRVSEQANIRTTSVRLGQVCGDQLGHWNEKEWFPALVKTAQFQRCLPDIEGVSTICYPALSRLQVAFHRIGGNLDPEL